MLGDSIEDFDYDEFVDFSKDLEPDDDFEEDFEEFEVERNMSTVEDIKAAYKSNFYSDKEIDMLRKSWQDEGRRLYQYSTEREQENIKFRFNIRKDAFDSIVTNLRQLGHAAAANAVSKINI